LRPPPCAPRPSPAARIVAFAQRTHSAKPCMHILLT
jgi:hypothetical protein